MPENTSDDYPTAIEKVTDYFAPKKIYEFEVYKFHQEKQQSGKSIDDFHTKLRQLSITCEFADADKEIKSQVIQTCLPTHLRCHALREEMDLTHLLTFALTLELSDRQATEIEKSERENANAITKGRTQSCCRNKPCHMEKKGSNKQQYRNQICRNCGGEYPHKDRQCPAKGKLCVRQNLEAWIKKLECDGDIEKQHAFKKKFLERLKTSPIAIETDKANEQHYEVPTEFFKIVLGPRLKYSCCYWPDGVKALEEAENLSLQQYCDRAKVQDGQSILDLGCGWGSMGLYICEKYPHCHVTCVSNSNTQRQFIESKALKHGFLGRLEVITADANVFASSKRFDRIISIEMFEHVKNYEILMQRVASWLKPSGLLFIQILCHRLHPYAFDTKPGSDTEWMAKNFFTGGTMPSTDLYLYFQNDLKIMENWVLNGTHYSKTLEYWLSTMDQNMDRVKEIFRKAYGDDADQQIFNWRLFFIFCSEVFGFRGGNEWHVSQHLFRKQAWSAL